MKDKAIEDQVIDALRLIKKYCISCRACKDCVLELTDTCPLNKQKAPEDWNLIGVVENGRC